MGQKMNRRTIPVVYGKRMEGKAVLGLSVTMAFMAVIGPFMSFIWTGNSTWRQIMLSLLGSTMVVNQSFAPKQHLQAKTRYDCSLRRDLHPYLAITRKAPTLRRRSIPHSAEPRVPPAH